MQLSAQPTITYSVIQPHSLPTSSSSTDASSTTLPTFPSKIESYMYHSQSWQTLSSKTLPRFSFHILKGTYCYTGTYSPVCGHDSSCSGRQTSLPPYLNKALLCIHLVDPFPPNPFKIPSGASTRSSYCNSHQALNILFASPIPPVIPHPTSIHSIPTAPQHQNE